MASTPSCGCRRPARRRGACRARSSPRGMPGDRDRPRVVAIVDFHLTGIPQDAKACLANWAAERQFHAPVLCAAFARGVRGDRVRVAEAMRRDKIWLHTL